jgi:hypothetical protein
MPDSVKIACLQHRAPKAKDPTSTKLKAVFGAIRLGISRPVAASFEANNHSSTFGCQFAPIPISFARPMSNTIKERMVANLRAASVWFWRIDMARASPATMKQKAVAGFIVTKPGRTRFNNSTPKSQPASTRTPTQIALALAAAGNIFNRIGSSDRPSLDPCFSNTNYHI